MAHFRVWTEDKIEWLKSTKEILRADAYKMFLEAFPDCYVTIQAFSCARIRYGATYSTKHNRVWTNERIAYVQELKDYTPETGFRLFNERFPGVTTINGYKDARSRHGGTNYKRPYWSTKNRPIYSEHEKKGYIHIKVALPNVWMPKHKWVWMEYNPHRLDEINPDDVFIFLDGDKRNFHPDNITYLHRNEQPAFIHAGGVVPGDPKATYIHLLMARLKIKSLDIAEEAGLTKVVGNSRVIYDEYLAMNRVRAHGYYWRDPEKSRAKQRAYMAKRKQTMTEEQKQRRREIHNKACRKYLEKKRKEKQNVSE